MRELKFRAWKDGVMVGPFEMGSMMSEIYCTERDIIEQYTGLKDKNGVEICEGDILKWSDGYKHAEYYSVVVCDNGSFMSKRHRPSVLDKIRRYNTSGATTYNYEVVGNIHENGDLLQ